MAICVLCRRLRTHRAKLQKGAGMQRAWMVALAQMLEPGDGHLGDGQDDEAAKFNIEGA